MPENLQSLVFKALSFHQSWAERPPRGLLVAPHFSDLFQHEEDGEGPADETALACEVAIQVGRTFAWRTEMLDLAKYAAATLPRDWTFWPTALVSPNGVAFFERPVTIEESRYAGLIWNVAGETPAENEGFIYDLSASPERMPDAKLVLFAYLLPVDNREAPVLWLTREGETNEWLIDEAVDDSSAFFFLASLFELSSQRLAQTQRHRAESRAARRAIAAWRPEGFVDIVQLRRRVIVQSSPSEENPQDWSCRWLVGAHWHRYWTNDGVIYHYLSTYVKGPPDKPLRVPARSVFAVVR